MCDLNGINIAPINDSKLFERLCRDLWKNDESNINVQLYGSSGQVQEGVDIFGHKIDNNKWFGIQCKVIENKLTQLDINFDRFRITKWINSIKNLDKFIYSNEDSLETYITKKEYTKYLEAMNEL